MDIIRSRTHESIKSLVALKQVKERRAQGLFVAEGVRVISSLLASHIHLKQLYCLENDTTDAVTLCRDFNLDLETSVTLISDHVLEKITSLTTSSGIVAVFHIPKAKPLDQLSAGMVLANIQSPGNMGTMIRSAAAMKVHSVVIIEGTDIWSPKVVQASAGEIGVVNLFECSWDELMKAKKQLQLCALVVRGGAAPQSVDASQALLVVGNEAHGLPDNWIADCDTRITLPMPGNTESLNAAVALSIALYICFVHEKI